jgi:hypothetical protein
LFSLRDTECQKLLKRLRGMHRRLPDWMRQRVNKGCADSLHEIEFANGSTAQALTSAGDSYTASLVVVDEADLLPDLAALLESLEPTIGDGGRMLLISKADKSQPESAFKKIYKAAKADNSPQPHWRGLFLPWNARPDRSQAWYDEEKRSALNATGSLDGFSGNYPATDAEAMAPRTLDKRIAAKWVLDCYTELPALDLEQVPGAPAIPGLTVFRLPVPGRQYCCGGDPAMGNPTSDDSGAEWFDVLTGEQVAELRGKIEMTVFGGHLITVCTWFNNAPAMIEENNHGHTVLKHMRENGAHIRRLSGHKGREGWLSSQLGKTILYDATADAFREGEVLIHSFSLCTQLCSIEGNTLRAPKDQPDDLADAAGFAIVGRLKARPVSKPSSW